MYQYNFPSRSSVFSLYILLGLDFCSLDMAKRARTDPDSSVIGEEGHEASGSASTLMHHHELFRIHQYSVPVTIVRKQHLTITPYKPGDTTTTDYGVTFLPHQFFEFYANATDTRHRKPYEDMQSAFPYCIYHNTRIRLSHFIPLQKSLQGTTATDVTAFNIAPYMYIARDTTGFVPKIVGADNIGHKQALNQSVRTPSTPFWPTDKTDYWEGLLSLQDVTTMGSGAVWEVNIPCPQPLNRLMWSSPQFNKNSLTYLPMDICTAGTEVLHADSCRRYTAIETIPGTPPTTITVTNSEMLPPKYDRGAIALFLPHIEPISDSENIIKMMGHVLLETELNMTMFSNPDGYQGVNSNTGLLQRNTNVATIHLVNSKEIFYSPFVR